MERQNNHPAHNADCQVKWYAGKTHQEIKNLLTGIL